MPGDAITPTMRLWEACTRGDLGEVKSLCLQGPVDLNFQDPEFRRTPLYRAAGHGFSEIVEFLLEQPGVDVNLLSSQGGSPFYIACQKGATKVVSMLLSHPLVNVCQPSNGGHTPLSAACEHGNLNVVDMLVRDGRIDVNARSVEGATAFFMACQVGQLDIVKYLANQEKVDLNLSTNNGATPFFIACEKGHLEIVRFLAHDPRIDVNRAKENETTPLWMAGQNNLVEIVKVMMVCGKELEAAKVSKWNYTTPSAQARNMGNTEVAELIDRYERDQAATVFKLKLEMGILDDTAAMAFALVIFLMEDLLELAP